jgi:hypothetical protein
MLSVIRVDLSQAYDSIALIAVYVLHVLPERLRRDDYFFRNRRCVQEVEVIALFENNSHMPHINAFPVGAKGYYISIV